MPLIKKAKEGDRAWSIFNWILIAISGLILSCSQPTPPPNVLFIAIDDLRPELNCYGAKHIHSPNIDRLATRGVQFMDAHAQQAICMASRASILTGIRPEHRGIYTGNSVQDLAPDVTTLNRFFEQNGYSVAALGKIYHFDEDRKAQFGDQHLSQGEWLGRGYVGPEAAKHIALNVAQKGERIKGKGYPFERVDVADNAYEDGYNAERAVKQLEVFKEKDQPFFLALGFKKPHLPFNAPKKYWDKYPIEQIAPPSITQWPKNTGPHCMRDWGELRGYYGMPQKPNDLSLDSTLILRQAYFACVSYVDALIGQVLNKLDELALTENTVIVLWADHGFKLGDYNNWCKWSNLKIDTNVPFILSGPGVSVGEKCKTPVELLDIYPTLADLCGLDIPSHLDGKSLKPLLEQPQKSLDREIYTIWPHERKKYEETIMGYSIKNTQFNYIEWVNLSSGEVLDRELYDHQIDPNETKNIVNDVAYTNTVQLLSQKIAKRKEATDHQHPFGKK